MIKTISAADARKHFGEITNRVAYSGEEYEITKHGKLLAKLVAPYRVSKKSPIDPEFYQHIKEFEKHYGPALRKLAKN